MKKYFWLWMLVLCAIVAHAQSPRKLDSLRTVLAQLPPEGSSYASDTMRVRMLCEVALQMPFNQIDSTILFLQNPLRISKKVRWALGECMAYYHIAYLYVGKNEVMKGVEFLYKSLSIAEKNKLKFYIARNNKTLGDAYSSLGNFLKSREHLNKSISIFHELGYKREELLAINNLGLAYILTKDYQNAIRHFEYAINQNKLFKIKNLDNIFLANLGDLQRHLGRYSEAISNLMKVDTYLKNQPNSGYRRLLNLNSIIEVWLMKNDLQRSKISLLEAGKLQKLYGTEVSQKDIYKAYYSLYKKENNFKIALSYYEKYIELQKKTTQQDQEQQIKNLQASFDNEKKTSEINLLNQNLQQEALIKNFFIGGAILLLLSAIWFWQNSQKLSKQNITIENQRTELQSINEQLECFNQGLEQKVIERTTELQQANETLIKKNEEIVLAMVEGQTIERKRVASELHDNLGATLSAIKWRLEAINGHNLTDKERKIHESTLEMMKGAYSEVRLISHNLLPAELEKGGFKGALEKFIADINSSGKLYISYDLQPEAVPTDKKIQLELYSIAMELLNNVLKHAQAQNAHVALFNETQQTVFEISDDGIGINLYAQSNGMGAKNIQNRVEALSGTIMYLNQGAGLTTRLNFPFFS